MSNFYTEPFVSAGEMEFPARPYITAQPQNHTATGPETYVLKVIAAGAVSYQWEVYNGISWASIPGATSDTLTITIDPSMDGWRYRVIVTGADGSTVVSKAAQIAVRGMHECVLGGAIVTFNGPAEIRSLEVDINAVQSGSGDPSPDNIRPISGWDDVNVFVKGANQWDEEWELVNNKVTSLNYIPVIPDAEYCFVKPANLTGITILYYDADYNMIGLTSIVASGISAYNFTPNSNAVWMKIQLPTHYGTTYNNDISINYPSTDTDYHTYQGTTYPITLPNTCYGGKIKDGVLMVTHWFEEILAFTGAVDGYARLAVSYNASHDHIGEQTTAIICNRIKTDRRSETFDVDYINIRLALTINRTVWTFFPRTIANTLAEANAWLANNPTYICYKLATPIEITLSDFPTITTLRGVNNLWADSGDISVTVII